MSFLGRLFGKKAPTAGWRIKERRELDDAQWQRVRAVLLGEEESSDFLDDEKALASYRLFVSETADRSCSIVTVPEGFASNPGHVGADDLSRGFRQLDGGNVLQDLVLGNKAFLVDDGAAVCLPDIVLAGLGDIERKQLGLGEQTQLNMRIERTRGLGNGDVGLSVSWVRNRSRLTNASRQGAFLNTGSHAYCLDPRFFMTADAVDRYNAARSTDHEKAWMRLQAFLSLCGVPELDDIFAGIRLIPASEFSLMMDKDSGALVPYLLKRSGLTALSRKDFSPLLPTRKMRSVLNQVDEGGIGHDYLVADSSTFVYLTPELKKVLSVANRLRRGTAEEKTRLLANPSREIAKYIDDEALVKELDRIFVETPEYLSDRVTALGPWHPKMLAFTSPVKTPWFEADDEHWTLLLGGEFVALTEGEIQKLIKDYEACASKGIEQIKVGGLDVDVGLIDIAKVRELADNIRQQHDQTPEEKPVRHQKVGGEEKRPRATVFGPIIKDNIEMLQYVGMSKGRPCFSHELRGLAPGFHLLEHQKEALKWLQELWNKGVPGALLADDMGLGKTLQCLSFMCWLRQGMMREGTQRPALVVAPVGLINNWAQEGEKYYSTVLSEPLILTGKAAKLATQQPLDDFLAEVGQSDWVLTNYETVRDKFELFSRVYWGLVVFDEAQRIKNPVSRLTETCKALQSDFTLAMTGTPVENQFSDLWSIMDTAVPGVMGALKDFHDRYEDPERIEESGRELHDVLTGKAGEDSVVLMLRRMKEDRLKSLPKKTIEVVKEVMPPEQAATYRQILKDYEHSTKELGEALRTLHLLAACSLCPQMSGDVQELSDEQIESSARLKAFFRILEQIRARREKVVVFVQHIRTQALVAQAVKRRFELRENVGQINGQMPIAARQRVVERFQNGPNGFDIVILTGRAAGTGLTLTAANHVIHLERWWNPAVEDQCSDRVYRIGQVKDVVCHVPLAVFGPNDQSSYDSKLDAFLETKRSRSLSVLMPSEGTNDAGEFVRNVFGEG